MKKIFILISLQLIFVASLIAGDRVVLSDGRVVTSEIEEVSGQMSFYMIKENGRRVRIGEDAGYAMHVMDDDSGKVGLIILENRSSLILVQSGEEDLQIIKRFIRPNRYNEKSIIDVSTLHYLEGGGRRILVVPMADDFNFDEEYFMVNMFDLDNPKKSYLLNKKNPLRHSVVKDLKYQLSATGGGERVEVKFPTGSTQFVDLGPNNKAQTEKLVNSNKSFEENKQFFEERLKIHEKVKNEEGETVDLQKYADETFKPMSMGQFEPMDRERVEILKKDPDIDQIARKIRNKSTALLGDAGTGKSYSLDMYTRLLLSGEYDTTIREVIKIDPGMFTSGGKYRGNNETRINNLVAYCKAKMIKVETFPESGVYVWKPTVLIQMDEMHSFSNALGGGTQFGNPWDSLKEGLQEGYIRISGGTTNDDFTKAFSADPATGSRFSKIEKRILEKDEILGIIKNQIAKSGLRVEGDNVYEKIYHYAHQYGMDNSPRLETSFLSQLTDDVLFEHGYGTVITEEMVKKGTQLFFNVDPIYFDRGRLQEVFEKKKFLEGLSSLIGLEDIKGQLYDLTLLDLTHARKPDLPPVRILMTGMEGSGKTYIASVFAKYIKRYFHKVNMSSFQGDKEKLLQELAQAIAKSPLAVILLDEIEKAGGEGQRALLPFYGDSSFNLSYKASDFGSHYVTRKISTKNLTIIATSNAIRDRLVEHFASITQNMPNDINEAHSKAIKEALRKNTNPTTIKKWLLESGTFLPETLRRFNAIMPVYPPTKFEFYEGLKLHLDGFIKEQLSANQRTITIKNREKFLKEATNALYRPELSMSETENIIARFVRLELAEQVRENPGQAKYVLDPNLGKLEKYKCNLPLDPSYNPFHIPGKRPIGFRPSQPK
ncbi:MAG: AAA family ATPase [Halobacteriovoraceae bacterium]|nr:AAA family ATPase [Halobacteriovoraceae bacterium]MCB9093991.1 AAA family ATPase [Halobacteriovoraceae bacterium]